MTGSRKIVNIFNSLEHCASYITFEELKTELTFEAAKEKRLTLNGMSLNPAKNISAPFDNFNRYAETVTGKDILQVSLRSGIVYEASSSVTEESADFQAEDNKEKEVSTHVYNDSLVVTSDSFQNKKK